MISALLASAMLATAAMAADTVVDLSRGDRVVLENIVGEVRVVTWDRDELQVQTTDDGRSALAVQRSGSRVELRPDDSIGTRI